ncbi:pentatricopeptide repeat-containing protein 1, mitochondrial [Hetaerina americana]|uniref:pentatricopeptide repeat-containing protein 1, mitochondrial n=1 Tax=Hetaerina americana TaxID=62018 RepID=UPI003A7F4CD9
MISKAIFRYSALRSGRNCDSYISKSRRYSEKAQLSLSSSISLPEVDDPDKFGIYSRPTNQYELVKPDRKDEIEEEKIEKKISRTYNHDTKCTKQIKELLKQRKVSEALSILDNGEISKPDGYVYGLLIKGCGNVGYTKKAFQLFNQMKKRGIKPRPSVYTSLFNACSNSPWKEDTLARATHLMNSLERVGYEPNDINYNAMIKAFGRGGDINCAFRLVDQMIDRGIGVASSTFAFLLQACVSDKEAGFRHAVIVWDKMLKNGIHPTVYTYNLLLRCCKDCGCGEGIDLKKLSSHDSIIQIAGRNAQDPLSMRKDILALPVKLKEESPEIGSLDAENNIDAKESNDKLIQPDKIQGRKCDEIILTNNEDNNRNEIVSSELDKYLNPASPQDRFQILGGCVGFLKQMAKKGVKPNIKTFTQLLDVIPQTESAEKELILALEKVNLEMDIEFYNMLMKNRTIRYDYEGARFVLPMMSAKGISPNIMSYGILAMGCRNKHAARQFMDEMKAAGFRLNAEIVGTLMKSACYRSEVFHVLELMEICIKEEIRPNAQLLQRLNDFKVKIRNALKEDKVNDSLHRTNQVSMTAYEIYCKRLASWLKEVDLSEAEDIHPWQQFRRHWKKEEDEHSVVNLP